MLLPAGQSTRHSEVGIATACQVHLGLRVGVTVPPPQLLVLLELGRWVLTLRMALMPIGGPTVCVWGCWEAWAQTVKYSLFGWAGHWKGRESLA